MTVSTFDKLKRFGIDIQNVKELDVLCLPENIEYASSVEELYDASDANNLSKLLKEKGLKTATAYDLGVEIGILERRAADLWLGLVWVLRELALPIVVGVFSSLLANRVLQQKSKVHITLYITREDDIASLKYDGDGETLLKILKSLNLREEK